MALIEIVSILTVKTLFSLDKNNNSMRLTLEAGVKAKADLQGADLRGADLWGADLWRADLREADLQEANLWEANLWEANLWEANLREANLQGASLQGASLRGADLWGADLRGANLQGADLQGADLRGADLREANLQGADLRGAKNAALIQAKTSIVPETGSFQAFKMLRDGKIGHLEIPDGIPRSNATGRKCRAQCVDVLSVFDKDGMPCDAGISLYDGTVVYRVGERVTCDAWDANRWNECSGGIHFYLTRIEAEHHQ